MNIFEVLNINTNLTPTPSSFNNGLSLYEDISKMIYLVNEMIKAVNDNSTEGNRLKDEYNNVLLELTSIREQFDFYTKGDTIPDGSISFKKFDKDILEVIDQYIQNYMYDLHKFVTFGLEDGNFVAYIPETWKDITFSTSVDGELVMEF